MKSPGCAIRFESIRNDLEDADVSLSEIRFSAFVYGSKTTEQSLILSN